MVMHHEYVFGIGNKLLVRLVAMGLYLLSHLLEFVCYCSCGDL